MPEINIVQPGTKGAIIAHGGCKTFFNSRDHQVFLYGATNSGKATRTTALVYDESGAKPIGSVKIGDKIFSNDGELTSITGVYPQGEVPIFRVTFSDGYFLDCAGDHLWKVTSKRIRSNSGDKWDLANGRNPDNWKCNKPIVLSTDEIAKTLNEEYWIPTTKPLKFRKTEVTIDPYLLGLILGDGGITKGSIIFSTSDDELIEEIQKRLPSGHTINKTKHGKYGYTITGQNRKNLLTKALRDYRLMGTSSSSKFIPTDYLFGSIKQRIELLQGLMDTDGSVDTGPRNCFEYSTSSEQLKDGFVHLCQSLGAIVKVSSRYPKYVYKGEKKVGKLSYRLNISLPNDLIPFKLKRKAVKVRKRRSEPHRKIVSVEPVGSAECVCIAVENPSHTYVTDHFIVTHNTYISCVLMMMRCMMFPGCKYLFTRSSYTALVKSGVETFEKVLAQAGWTIGRKPGQIRKIGESKPTEYIFPYARRVGKDLDGNPRVYEGKSRIILGSLDNARNELGAEYDFVYVNQPEQSEQEDWEFVGSRADGRHDKAPFPQIHGDPNPEGPSHWIKQGGYELEAGEQRTEGTKWRIIKSTYHDNPIIWDVNAPGVCEWSGMPGAFTKEGEKQVQRRLESMSPVMQRRLIFSEWAAFDGLVFDQVWDRHRHVIRTKELYDKYPNWQEWDSYWAIDFGMDEPFVWMEFKKHPEQDLYINTKYICMSQRTIVDHAKQIRDLTVGQKPPVLVVADRNPESILFLQQHLGYNVVSAKKGAGSRKTKINVLTDMLKNDQILFYEDALVEEDPRLKEKRLPIGFGAEAEQLQWKEGKDEPKDGNDHCIDAAGYLFTHIKAGKMVVPFIWL